MRKFSKVISMILALSMTATLLMSMPTVSAEADYAMIEFNESGVPTLTNITRWIAGGRPYDPNTSTYKPVKVGGKWGGSTDRNNVWGNGSIYSLCLDLSDSFLYNLDNGDKLKLTVEFWDGAHPTLNQPSMPEEGQEYARLRFIYPGYNYLGRNVSEATSSDIHVRQRDEWTRASIIIDNARCDNSLWGKWDFEFTDWGGSVNVARDVIIKSIKIEKVEDEKPIRLTDRINLGTTGNIENVEKEKLTLYIPMENTEETDADIDWTFEIYDENERIVDEFSYSTTVAAGVKKTDTVAFDTPELCGVYTIKAFSRAGYVNPETGRHETNFVSYDRENFSVSYINKVNEGNDNLGINVHTVGNGQGTTEEIADAVVAAGYGWIREANQPGASVDAETGEWTLSQAVVDDLAYYKNKGISIMNQIWGPIWQWEDLSHGGCIPQNDEERAIFRKYMEEYAEKTAPYVDAYEVFNECESSMFPSGYTGTVEDRADVYLESLKIIDEEVGKVNSNIPIVASASAGVFHPGFNRQLWALGANEYIDIFSTHRYPYHGSEYMRYVLVNMGTELEKKLWSEYIDEDYYDGKMWLTEIGYASPDIYADGAYTGQSGEKGYTWHDDYWSWHGFEDGIPRREQARGISNAYLVNTVTDEAFDKLFVLNIVDHDDPTYYQNTWGMLNYYKDGGKYTPYSAKPAFVATATFNHFIDDTSVVNTVIKGNVSNDVDYWHAAWFDNSNNEKFTDDVIVVQADVASSNAQSTDRYINLNTGASTVDVYDIYGNLLGTMKDSSGKYWIPITHEPYYLVGEFTKLEGTVSNFSNNSPIKLTNRYNKNVAPGSTATFTVSGMSTGDTIEVRGLDVESIDGGTVTVRVPNLYSGKAFGQVLVKDSAGNLKYANVVEFWLTVSDLQIKAYDNNLEIKGFSGLSNGGAQISALVTDDEGNYLAIDQLRSEESGIFEFDLRLPQNRSQVCNLRLYNGTVTLNQQIDFGTEFYYTCYKNGEKIPFANLNLENLAENDEIEFVLNLNNLDGKTPNVTLIGGVYDKDGLLVNADVSAIGVDEWDGETKQLRVSLTMEDVENIGELKFFTWDNEIKPIKDFNVVD